MRSKRKLRGILINPAKQKIEAQTAIPEAPKKRKYRKPPIFSHLPIEKRPRKPSKNSLKYVHERVLAHEAKWKKPECRPLAYNSAEKLQNHIDGYFKFCKKDLKTPTITGLAYALGVDRVTLINYENKEPYFEIIRSAKTYIESFLDQAFMNGKGNVGTIFVARAGFKWKDGTEANQNVSVNINSDRVNISHVNLSDIPVETLTDIVLGRGNKQAILNMVEKNGKEAGRVTIEDKPPAESADKKL